MHVQYICVNHVKYQSSLVYLLKNVCFDQHVFCSLFYIKKQQCSENREINKKKSHLNGNEATPCIQSWRKKMLNRGFDNLEMILCEPDQRFRLKTAHLTDEKDMNCIKRLKKKLQYAMAQPAMWLLCMPASQNDVLHRPNANVSHFMHNDTQVHVPLSIRKVCYFV